MWHLKKNYYQKYVKNQRSISACYVTFSTFVPDEVLAENVIVTANILSVKFHVRKKRSGGGGKPFGSRLSIFSE